MERLKLDFNFCMDKAVDSGLSDEVLDEYKAKARGGLSQLIKMQDAGDVGFMNLPGQDYSDIKNYTKKIKGTVNDLIVVGIGGSSLGLEAVCGALLPFGHNAFGFGERGSWPRVWIADNVDPSKMHQILKECTPEDTFVVVISKSGSTVETASNFCIIADWMASEIKDISKNIAVITDPEKGPLREITDNLGMKSFVVPDNVGGRFSVLSAVGLLPASLLGIDFEKMLQGAKTIVESDYELVITLSAIYMYFMDNGKNINVLMPYTSRLSSFADWFCQLWGESLGKNKTQDGADITFGTTPVKSVGAIDQHSQLQLYKEGPDDKIVTFIECGAHDNEIKISSEFSQYEYLKGKKLGELLNIELKATEAALCNTGKPNIKISIDSLDDYTLGKLFMLFQYVVPVIGLSAGINPFDQPGVEEGKQYAYGLLGRDGYSQMKDKFEEIYKKQDEYII